MTATEARREGPVWSQSMPPDWRLLKFSWVVDIAEGQIDPEDATHSDHVLIAPNHIESGTGRLLARETASEQGAISGKYPCRRGDVLYSKIRPALRKATIAEEDCLCSADMYPLRPRELLVSRYLLYLVVSRPFTEWAVLESDRVAMPKINRESLNDLRIPVPPVHVQGRLVSFLDSAVTKLDKLTAAKQRLLDLLAEKRKAIIATAVTRGLYPKVKLHDSDVPWLGRIPAHWEIERARWLFRERDVRSETGDEELLTVSHLTGVTPRSEKDVNMFEAKTNEGYKLCEPGDLVINTLWAWMGAMGTAPMKGIVSPAYNVYEPGSRLAPEYIDALVRLPVFAQEVTRYSKGVWSSRLRLYPEGFFEVCLPVPPMQEQHAIVEHIARETAKLDAVRVATERTIALLKERRAALIAAAVTGQLDLGVAA